MKLLRRFHDVPAHEGKVNCARLGRASAQVMATGGDDMKLNVWALGRQHPEKSLLSHESSVESVSFDPSDEYVASGSANGMVTLWDIPNEKVGRTFSGHRGAVKTVQFHPTKGYYIVSGASDSSINIWDARKKSCVCSLRSSTSKAATCTTFSPDGMWVAAGFANGIVELWDVRKGKELHTFPQHRDRITGIEFHPNECIMATNSQDGIVRLWDLENAETIEKIGSSKNPVKSICFSKDGECIYSALPDGLACYSWEPTHLRASVGAPWNYPADMAICEEYSRLIICTIKQNLVGSWVVNLKLLKSQETKDKESSQRSSSESIPSLKIETSISTDSKGESENSDRPNSGHLSSTSARFSEKYGTTAQYSDRSGKTKVYKSETESGRSSKNHIPSPVSTARTPSAPKSVRSPTALDFSTLQRSCHETSNQLPPKATYDRGMVSCRTSGETKIKKVSVERHGATTERCGSKKEALYSSKDLNIDAFIPKSRHSAALDSPGIEPGDEECIQDMLSRKDKIRRILSSRAFTLQIIRQFWERDDILETLKAIKKSDNPSVCVDFFEAGIPMNKILTLELIPSLIPLMVDMLNSNHEKYWSVALRILLQLLKTYGGTIRETINGSNMSIGVNLAFDQRHEKCKMAQECLLETLSIVDGIGKEHGESGILAREIHGRLSDLTT